jgi:hypothetical protein
VVRTAIIVSKANRYRSEESISLIGERRSHEKEAATDRARQSGSLHRNLVAPTAPAALTAPSAPTWWTVLGKPPQRVSLQPITDDWLPPLIVVVPPTGPPPLPEGMTAMYVTATRVPGQH